MKTAKIKRVLIFVTLISLASFAAPILAAQEQTDVAVSDTVGRFDPFEESSLFEQKPEPQQIQIKDTIAQPAQSQPMFRQPIVEEKPDLFVQTVMLKFLQAPDLKIALDNMTSEYGIIAADTKSNSLIISDTRENLAKIVGEAMKADKTPRQLIIEVVIVDVQLDDDKEIGINWDLLSSEMFNMTYRQNFTSRLGMTAESAATLANITAFNTTGTGGNLAVITGTVRNVVHALQEKKNVEILASPRVMVVSGESAFIETIEEIPYELLTDTGAGDPISTTEFKEVGIKLQVAAIITDDDEILLTIQPEQSVNTGVFGVDNVPIIDTRRAETTLLLRDGQVVIMGGLRSKETTRQATQIPFFGDLPIIGALFRSKKAITKHSELLVFLSPHIYDNQPPTEDQMRKFNELRDQPMLKIPTAEDLLLDPLPPTG